MGWQCSHRRVSTTGWEEVVLGSSSVALNSPTYLSFLEGLLGQRGLLHSIVRGWWDGNWDGSRSEEKYRARERQSCLWSLCTQPGRDRAACGCCVPSSSLCTPLKPLPCKARSQRHSPCPRAPCPLPLPGTGETEAPLPCSRGTDPAVWHVLANTAGLGRGQRMEASPGAQTRRPCRAGMCSGTQQSGLSWDGKKGRGAGVWQGDYSLSLSPSFGKVPQLFSAPTS